MATISKLEMWNKTARAVFLANSSDVWILSSPRLWFLAGCVLWAGYKETDCSPKSIFKDKDKLKISRIFRTGFFNVVLYKGNSVTLHMKSPSTIKYSICQIFTVSDTPFDARIVSLGENKRLKFGIRSQEPLKHRTYCWKSANLLYFCRHKMAEM